MRSVGASSARWEGRTNFDWSRENAKVGITTSGMFGQIFPLTPLRPSMGVKATIVVSTPKTTTVPTSLVPFHAATLGCSPLWMRS